MEDCRHIALKCVISGVASANNVGALINCVLDTIKDPDFDKDYAMKDGPACKTCTETRLKQITPEERLKVDPCNDYTKSSCETDSGCNWLKDCRTKKVSGKERKGLCVSAAQKCPSGEPEGGDEKPDDFKFRTMAELIEGAKSDKQLTKATCKEIGGKFKKNTCTPGKKIKCKKIKNLDNYCLWIPGCKLKGAGKCGGKTQFEK